LTNRTRPPPEHFFSKEKLLSPPIYGVAHGVNPGIVSLDNFARALGHLI